MLWVDVDGLPVITNFDFHKFSSKFHKLKLSMLFMSPVNTEIKVKHPSHYNNEREAHAFISTSDTRLNIFVLSTFSYSYLAGNSCDEAAPGHQAARMRQAVQQKMLTTRQATRLVWRDEYQDSTCRRLSGGHVEPTTRTAALISGLILRYCIAYTAKPPIP